jgi:hypothetical protein
VTKWFRALSEVFHWTPQQIGRMTLPQVEMYLAPDKQSRRRISLEEYERRRAAKG